MAEIMGIEISDEAVSRIAALRLAGLSVPMAINDLDHSSDEWCALADRYIEMNPCACRLWLECWSCYFNYHRGRFKRYGNEDIS